MPEVESEAESESESEAAETPAMIANDNVYGTLESDAWRRDITINALFYNPSDYTVVDYVGGMKDIQHEIVRVIGDPNVRFAEDPIRIWRSVRHAVKANFSIEEKTWEAVVSNRKLLSQASQVRLFEEFKKDLLGGFFVDTCKVLQAAGLLEMLLPELSQLTPGLFLNHSAFVKLMGQFDELNQAKDKRHTQVLGFALMALTIRGQQLLSTGQTKVDHNYKEMFNSHEEIDTFLSHIFSSLMLPRKDREKIESMLKNFWDLLQAGNGKEQGAAIRTVRIRDIEVDFSALMKMLAPDVAYKLRAGRVDRHTRFPRFKKSAR